MAKQKAYFGLDWIVSLIIVIFVPVGWICGMITCFQRENWLGLIVRIFLYYPIFWVIDLVTIVLHKDLTVLA